MIARGKIAQLRIGTPKPLAGAAYASAYWRSPVAAPVMAGELGLEGDRVGNPRVHGGAEKAIYAYPASGYAAWAAEFPALAAQFVPGAMGENLVVTGLDENSVHLGDVIRCGAALCQVAQIREPCSTFAAAMGTARVVKAMARSGRCGWYLRVLEPGPIAPGDGHDVIERPNPAWPISRFTPIAAGRAGTLDVLLELAALPGLSANWRARLQRQAAAQQHGQPSMPAPPSPR